MHQKAILWKMSELLTQHFLSENPHTMYSTKPSYVHKVGEQPLKYVTIGQLLEEVAKNFGDRKAIISVHQDKFLTFSELLDKTDKVAASFKLLNLEKNDRLGIWAPNLLEWCITMMACARAGLIAVCLNPVYEAPEIKYCINKTQMKALVCGDKFKHRDYYETMLNIAPELQKCDPGKLQSKKVPSLKTVIRISDDFKRGTYTFDQILDMATSTEIGIIQKLQLTISPDDGCSLHFTSETTGKPKAALATHFKMINNGFLIGKRMELAGKHHTICVQVPLFHVFGTVGIIMAALNFASTIVLPTDGYQPEKSLDAVQNQKCTVITGTPTMFLDLIETQEKRKEPVSVEKALLGGAPSAPHLLEQILKTLNMSKVNSVYGLTECTASVFQSVPIENSPFLVYYLQEHVEAKVINDKGEMVPFGTPGELCIRGYCNMQGYWEDEEKTNEMLSKDGWLKTGDQFILEEDGSGKAVGRLKIEELVVTHPLVVEVQVIGTPHKRLGEEVCVCVRIKPQSHLTLEELATFCKGKLAYFKIPTKMEIFENFPRTASGKIQKFKLQEMLL
ncbi:medium-chain acyl-CoA ligase ACSF2, mitochondrial-like isoform X2 [Zophobas morio]|uniref:medium-chain acyl-CoA ligase ACSF2, mitochondrial-like isoform X2 n=1 Tax=Zophobas morio TaxID=2755281 RepID=UPI00308365CC